MSGEDFQNRGMYSEYDDPSEKPIDFKYYLFLVKKNAYIILTFFIIVVTFASIYVSKIPDKYAATAQVIVERPAQQRWQGDNVVGLQGESHSGDYYATQIEIMRSTSVLVQVARELKLAQYYGIENEEALAGRLRGMLHVKQVQGTRVFRITMIADTSDMAANLANAMSRAYIRKNFENILYYSKEVLAWLPEAAGGKEVISVEDPFGDIKQMTRKQLINSLPSIQTDPAVRSLKEKLSFQEAELESLKERFRDKHPVMIKARANIKFLGESIEAEKLRVVEDLKLKAQGRFKVGHARFIEQAKPPGGPLPNQRARIVAAAGFVEILLCILIIVLLDYFDDTVRSPEDLDRKGINLPFLGPIPLLKEKAWQQQKGEKKELMGYYGRNSEAAESFRYLRVAINFSASPESLKVLMLSSCLPHEGKSFNSHNIAISFALDGNRTLLIDADLRRPVLHTIFQVDNSTGLSNFLTSNVEMESVVKETFIENLSIITSGPVSPNPGEILGSQRMKDFLTDARKKYDRVIIDCPPLTGIGDSYVLGSLLGQMIMVIHAGRTPVDLIKHTQKQLDKTGVKVIGVILSMVDMEKERYGGYSKHYYQTYTRYYNPQKPPNPGPGKLAGP